jgi:hypothetical protein
MARPAQIPSRGFFLPPELTPFIKKIVPNYDNDTATITAEIKGQIIERTIPFQWEKVADFEERAASLVRRLL